MTYSICTRLVCEGSYSYMPHLEQLEFEDDIHAKYYAVTHSFLDYEVTEWLKDRLEEKLNSENTQGDFCFWIQNETLNKRIYTHPTEDDFKWYVLSFLKEGEV